MVRALVMVILAALLPALAASAQEYLIQPGDTLDISVLEDPGLNRQALVRPDGKITMPLAGAVQAAGRSPEAVASAIRRALARDFVEPPSVSVALTGIAQPSAELDAADLSTVFVIGAVNSPGRYEIELPMDILQALALSGGPGVFAATDRIQVRRRVEGREVVFLFDYEMVEDGALPNASIALTDGDVIVVPERGLFD